MSALVMAAQEGLELARLFHRCHMALDAADILVKAAKDHVATLVLQGDKIDRDRMDAQQYAAHGLAWIATYVETLRETLAWAERLHAQRRCSVVEILILRIGFGEYLAQLAGGIAMSQNEIIRPHDMGLDHDSVQRFQNHEMVNHLIKDGTSIETRAILAHHIRQGEYGDTGLDDMMTMVQDQFRRFVEDKVAPHAHDWHLNDTLIPDAILDEMSELGVFGLTIPEEFGGSGMGKLAMCVVSEELSRGYIGVGSLGTRSEIAAELILAGGTPEQKAEWLPKIASGETLPTAVFTEPNTGSDLGSLRTRAMKDNTGDHYTITGNKTWITHAVRADMMTLLVRTDTGSNDYRGLSMFLAPKQCGTTTNPFPAPGMSGGEIGVLGYRGMKEYELGFDGFQVDAKNLLGGVEGQGFKQLMTTFESARIQTAARAIGVARSALELGQRYAMERVQFGKPIAHFPRIWGKLVMSLVEIMMVRQLNHFAAHQKDTGKRCDLEAGMAKLLAARIAWSTADNALQIHGGNGYALEYPISRILCDARILNIFEGAAEIQADVIARRILTPT